MYEHETWSIMVKLIIIHLLWQQKTDIRFTMDNQTDNTLIMDGHQTTPASWLVRLMHTIIVKVNDDDRTKYSPDVVIERQLSHF